jgi:hypothetical protein
MADAWIIEELNSNGDVVWECVLRQRPTNMSWYKDIPSKTHTLRITELEKNMNTIETHTNIKSLKDATKRLVEANNGL